MNEEKEKAILKLLGSYGNDFGASFKYDDVIKMLDIAIVENNKIVFGSFIKLLKEHNIKLFDCNKYEESNFKIPTEREISPNWVTIKLRNIIDKGEQGMVLNDES